MSKPAKREADPYTAKPVSPGTPLLTSHVLRPEPYKLTNEPRAALANTASAAADTQRWSNPEAARSTGLPSKGQAISVVPGFDLQVGLYILAAPTGAGKTVLTMALTAWLNSLGIPSTYTSCFEPRSPTAISKTGQVMLEPFRDPSAFWDNVSAQAPPSPPSRPAVLVYDSGTLPISTYAAQNPKAFTSQPTFPGGMQPSSRAWVDAGYKIAEERRKCIIVVINSSLIPYVNDLAGATEGLITIVDVGTFAYADRSAGSKRAMVEQTIPTPFVDGALQYFGFGPYNATKARSWKSTYIIN
jgi:hypothetical protein